jgi:hypothetical protein
MAGLTWAQCGHRVCKFSIKSYSPAPGFKTCKRESLMDG